MARNGQELPSWAVFTVWFRVQVETIVHRIELYVNGREVITYSIRRGSLLFVSSTSTSHTIITFGLLQDLYTSHLYK
ncbi:hypothetical protein M7I_2146 [Glarea lozoyensis 74030]|uniref:Uncharacterized protein n=1 Tax=Glarea lozoyensis (strain ATCC 74030 / MF5533) TaxID=1104152 RepID=H0EI01_GLAL7|nr:hypothetical protein M7I_2146 [Glarea lozoyensis 74030]